MTGKAIEASRPGPWARVGHLLLHELRELLAPTIFFFVGFNLILFTKRLILAEYLIQFAGFFIATVSALVVGKVVLIANALPFLRRFDGKPLAAPILFKTVVYTFFVLVARLIEAFIHYLIEGGVVGHGGFIEHVVDSFSWDRFIAVQMWIFVLFLVYVTASEITALFGEGELFNILFRRRSPGPTSIPRDRRSAAST
jgi:hypothetical protein